MEISKKSWHARLIRFAFDTQPKSLCTYFWTLVLALCLVPTLGPLIIIPYLIFEDGKPKSKFLDILYVFAGFIGLFAIALLYSMGAMFFVKFGSGMWQMGVAGWVVCVVILTALLTSYFKSIFRSKMERKEKRPNLLIEFFKAKKQKICPKINYKD